MLKKMLYIIDLPYAYYGIIVENSIIIESPPIARWMTGKNIVEIEKWIATKNGKMREFDKINKV